MEREGGKKGANYFNNAKGEAAQERRRKAEEKYGATPGHGSRKPGVDAGISGATSTHEEKLNAEMRKQKAKDYKDSRPKADIKEQSPLNDFEKAKRMAEEMAATKESNELAGIDSEEDLQDNFDIYLVNRGFNFSPEQIDELYATFQIK